MDAAGRRRRETNDWTGHGAHTNRPGATRAGQQLFADRAGIVKGACAVTEAVIAGAACVILILLNLTSMAIAGRRWSRARSSASLLVTDG